VNLLNIDGLWQKLLTNKYLNSKSLSQVKAKPYDSHFWRGLMKIKDEVLQHGSFSVKDGEKTRFWEDTWVGSTPFRFRYPSIYNIVRDPHATVAKVMATSPLNVSFRRALVDNNLNAWNNLVAQLVNVEIGEGSDTFRWDLTQTGKFSVNSMYSYLINTSPPVQHKKIWKLKIPLKIKIFLWYLKRSDPNQR
jgi:hypothetical protein